MAKKSIIARHKRRLDRSERVKSARLALKQAVLSGSDQADDAQLTLQKKSPNDSQTRVRNRCQQCGRGKGTYRRFGLCRICLRISAMKGFIPGLKKASW